MRQCEIYLHGVKCGVLTEDDNLEFTFEYDKDYFHAVGAEPVSLTLPLQDEPFKSPYLFPAFANLLSEGENRQVQSQLLRIDPECFLISVLFKINKHCHSGSLYVSICSARWSINAEHPARMSE